MGRRTIVSLFVVVIMGVAAPALACSVGAVDPATGIWQVLDFDGESRSFYYGNPGDYPFVGDWDCDGSETPGLYRQSDGFVYLRNSNSQGVADIRFFFGNPGDVPIVGDFDDDGCDTVSIYRPSEARFYIINELGSEDGGLGAAEYSFLFGNVGDVPFAGDWDGIGGDGVGLRRPSDGFVYLRQTTTTGSADISYWYGNPGDIPFAGDFDGVLGDTVGLYRPSNGTFYMRNSLSTGVADETIKVGSPGWLPVSGDLIFSEG